jgi:hypothetical protein
VSDRLVAVEAALVAWGLLSMVEMVHDGVPRRAAARRSYQAVFTQPLFDPMVGAMALQEFQHGTRCVAFTALETRELLLTDPTSLPVPVPMCVLPDDVVREVGWQLESVRRVMEGVPVQDAGRQALDAAAGRPRRRRKPLDPLELLDRVAATRGEIEAALWRQGWLVLEGV